MDDLVREYMPHGHCFMWAPSVFWPMLIGNLGIALAYFAIPAAMVLHWRKYRAESRIVLPGVFALFFSCRAIAHLLNAAVLWWGDYGISAWWDCMTACVSLWAAWRITGALVTTRAEKVAAAVEVVSEASVRGALPKGAIQELYELAHDHDRRMRTYGEEYETLRLVILGVPGVAILLGVLNSDGLPVVEYAGGELLTSTGYDPLLLHGMLVRDIPDTDPRLEEYYLRAINGERHTQELQQRFVATFAPVKRSDGTSMVLVKARFLGGTHA